MEALGVEEEELEEVEVKSKWRLYMVKIPKYFLTTMIWSSTFTKCPLVKYIPSEIFARAESPVT